MEKTDLMAIGAIVKIGLAFVGIATTFVLLVTGLLKKDMHRLKRAGMVFAGTWIAIVLLSAIEFAFLTTMY